MTASKFIPEKIAKKLPPAVNAITINLQELLTLKNDKRAKQPAPLSEEIVDIVDKDDCIVGVASRKEAHEKGLLHRAVLAFMEDREGRLWIPRRHPVKKSICPGHLDCSVSEHVQSGEDRVTAIKRGLAEELGEESEPVFLVSLGRPFLSISDADTVVCTLHIAFLDGKNPEVDFDREEMDGGNWTLPKDVFDMMTNPAQNLKFTPWFRDAYYEFLSYRLATRAWSHARYIRSDIRELMAKNGLGWVVDWLAGDDAGARKNDMANK